MKDPDRKEEQPVRRAYEPPAIEEDETFETLALACGKASGPRCGVPNS